MAKKRISLSPNLMAPNGSIRLQHRRATFLKRVTTRNQWRAGRDSNPRPSGSKKNPNPRKINDLRSSDRHMAAQSGISRHPGRHSRTETAPRRH